MSYTIDASAKAITNDIRAMIGAGRGRHSVKRVAHRIAFVALAAAAACRHPSAATVPTNRSPVSPRVDLAFDARPVRDAGPEVSAVAVHEEIRGDLDQSERPLRLRIGIVYTSRAGIADRVDSLSMRDASGVVPLRIENDPENKSGYTYYRHWRAERHVQPPVIVTYRMRPAKRPTGGPQYELYAHDGGISGHGSQLFVLPESLGTANLRVKWDVSELARGSIAASTFGDGDFQLRARPDTLVGCFFLVGPLGRYDPPRSNAGFEAYWLGHPVFDPRKELSWLFQAYENMRRFYRDPDASPYHVFLRAVGQGGGTASGRSFMGAVAAGAEDSTKRAPRTTIAHEIGHYFVGDLTGDDAQGGWPWYEEGVNEHYTRLLLARAGLLSVNEYLTAINGSARGYYMNPYRSFTNDSTLRIGYSAGFGPAGPQNLAYTRGSLFWADIDARIRARANGRRKLDDVLLPLLQSRRRGQPLTQNVLFDALAAELGPFFREHFDAVITRGETLEPVSDAFGPCLRRVPMKYAEANSGREVNGYAWERVPSIPDEKCREW